VPITGEGTVQVSLAVLLLPLKVPAGWHEMVPPGPVKVQMIEPVGVAPEAGPLTRTVNTIGLA
jgi:hypothetical protein